MIDFTFYESYDQECFFGFDFFNKSLYKITLKKKKFIWEGVKVFDTKKVKKEPKSFKGQTILGFPGDKRLAVLLSEGVINVVNLKGVVKDKIQPGNKVNQLVY